MGALSNRDKYKKIFEIMEKSAISDVCLDGCTIISKAKKKLIFTFETIRTFFRQIAHIFLQQNFFLVKSDFTNYFFFAYVVFPTELMAVQLY